MPSVSEEEIKETLTAIKRILGIAVATIEDEHPLDDKMHRSLLSLPLFEPGEKLQALFFKRGGQNLSPYQALYKGSI
jgi:hypothetical protein